MYLLVLDPVNFYRFCVYVHIRIYVAIQSEYTIDSLCISLVANVRLHVLVSLLLKLPHYQDVGIHVLLAATKQGVTVSQVDPAYIYTHPWTMQQDKMPCAKALGNNHVHMNTHLNGFLSRNAIGERIFTSSI